MVAISRSRRALAGIVLIVAGALFLLTALLPLVGVSVPWFGVLAALAMAVALVILGIGAVNNKVAMIALLVGALGWLLLAISGLGFGLPAGVVTAGAVLAAFGTLIGAIVLLVGREVGNDGALAFLVAAVLAVIYLLGVLAVFALGAVGTAVIALLGVALVVTGWLFRRPERRR